MTHSRASSPQRVDRLSLLPPELVSHIFELAYDPEEPLEFPLSKQLLSYFYVYRYRHVQLFTRTALSQFLATTRQKPSLAKLVVAVDTSELVKDDDDAAHFDTILRTFSSLKYLETHWTHSGGPLVNALAVGHSTLSTLVVRLETLSLDHLAALQHFPRLKCLTIAFTDFELVRPPPVPLPPMHVEKLSFRHFGDMEGNSPWKEPLAAFVDHLPNLRDLKLYDDDWPDYRDFLAHLNIIHTSLKSLTLGSGDLIDVADIASDSLLPRFPSLERLDLEDGTLAERLPSHLVGLRHLSYLRLGENTELSGPSLKDLLPLIEGPHRLPNLRTVVLDAFGRKMGDRVKADFKGTPSLNGGGWDGWGAGFEFWSHASVDAVLEAGLSNRVEVKGTVIDAVDVRSAYRLDRANRIVLRAYQSKQFHEWRVERTYAYNRLPDVELDELDPLNLRLVKIDLPGEDWFQWTLANGTDDEGNGR
ncbi:hypothetical protein JCM11491_004474 [Sporobolomyces phaffii]